jgi:multidrug resistance efflux pump
MNEEKKIIEDIKDIEKNITREIEQEIKKSIFSKPWVQSLAGFVVIVALLVAFIFWRMLGNQIKIENSFIDAPVIALSPTTPGILEEIYVNVGQEISPNTNVAKVGNEIIVSKVGGIIASVNHQEGQIFSPGTPVVSMINTDEEKVVGQVDENKGLSDIKVGQVATFTVDAFGSKKYVGVVDSISQTADDTGVVFSISDKRPTKIFDVKVRFNIADYPELKNGMSAKITVYTK